MNNNSQDINSWTIKLLTNDRDTYISLKVSVKRQKEKKNRMHDKRHILLLVTTWWNL